MIKLAHWPDVERVLRNLCERHRKNACMLSATDDPVCALATLGLLKAGAVTVWKHHEPVAVAGASITHPGHASTFFYGTPRWPEKLLEITRFFTRDLLWALRGAGVRRLSVFAPAGDPEGERWKRIMGCEHEATLRNYGKNGEDFNLFVRWL